MVFLTARPTTEEEINNIFREEAPAPVIGAFCGVAEDPIVSSDVIMDPRASIVDLSMTKVSGRRSGQGHELVRQRVGLYQPDDPEAVRIARECLS